MRKYLQPGGGRKDGKEGPAGEGKAAAGGAEAGKQPAAAAAGRA